MASAELDGEKFDVVVLGTGLEESILASSIAEAGQTVLHIDKNPYYGGPNASFSLYQLFEWATSRRDFRQTPLVEILVNTGLSDTPTFVIDTEQPVKSEDNDAVQQLAQYATNPELLPQANRELQNMLQSSREYAIELAPKVALCRGQLVELLIDCGIGEYVQFKGIENNMLLHNGKLERVPESKEDVFASTSLSLIEKRKLMKLLTTMHASTEQFADLIEECKNEDFEQLLRSKFKLDGMLLDAVLYAVARVNGKVDAPEGCERVRKYVMSIGRYGRMAYLCGMYGGGSEIAQAFCRLCAVSGGTYILNQQVTDITCESDGYAIRFDDATVKARRVIMNPIYDLEARTNGTVVSRAICILDQPVLGEDTSAMLSYQSHSLVSLLYMTHATMAVPSGQSVIYAWTTGSLVDTKPLLIEALTRTIVNKGNPLLTVFIEVHELDTEHADSKGIITTCLPDPTIDMDSAVSSAYQKLAHHFSIKQ
ncbi:hypothetical protein IWW36_002828 [Coemansia brasiliensis]|uniref:Rab proteins geranylgeranyltransferase component n=1 Tax=Coemansia brasiliensis TaxID=2650707 RepID=A0A9W8I8X1_9FUNG|nr:hypothetical protein IWW36_002828 [Coemansia brasiliensis]